VRPSTLRCPRATFVVLSLLVGACGVSGAPTQGTGPTTGPTGPASPPSTRPSVAPANSALSSTPPSSAAPTPSASVAAVSPATSSAPSVTATASGSPAASPGSAALPTWSNPAPQPLPAPVLTSPDAIAAALTDPGRAAQGVSSMLRLLGIGIYQPDGTPIRRGSEASDRDFYLFEPEAQGLVDLAERSSDDDGQIAFRDYHAALAGLGFKGSADDLATAYENAYAARPDTPMATLVENLGGVDVDGSMSRLEMWLLLLDGFIPAHGSSAVLPDDRSAPIGAVPRSDSRVIAAAMNPRTAGTSGSGWGVAASSVAALSSVPLEADPAVIAQILLVARTASVSVTAEPGAVDEGVGGAGSPATIRAQVAATASTFVSPFSGRALIPMANGLAGLQLTWTTSPTLDAHGQTSGMGAPTDEAGATSFIFTPKEEAAEGKGAPTQDVAVLRATVPDDQLITRLYGLPSLGAMAGGNSVGIGLLDIRWHEPKTMSIDLSEDYHVTIDTLFGTVDGKGRDGFRGTLAKQSDGTWRGTVTGSAAGSYNGKVLGESCSSSWSGTQAVDVVGQPAPDATHGNFVFLFTPVSDPAGNLGNGTCPTTRHVAANGLAYLPYNDASISDPDDGQGLVVALPDPPGGSHDDVTSVPGLVDATWHVTIGYSGL
jgi:hypothetical protein